MTQVMIFITTGLGVKFNFHCMWARCKSSVMFEGEKNVHMLLT